MKQETTKQVTKYYTIPTTVEKPIPVPSKAITGLEDMVGADGIIQVELEKYTVIERLSKDIYKNPLSAIRELVNNEARACRTAIAQGHDATINISIDPQSRNLVIEGNNSMGMTKEIFRNVYTVIGRSGNLDDSESGMFGFGRISYVGLSDVIVVETFARETDEKYLFIGKGGKVMIPMPIPQRENYGTKIQITIRKEKENEIDLFDVVEYVKNICKFLKVPVFLTVDAPLESSRKSDTIEAGTTQIGPISEKEFLIEKNKRFTDTPWIEIENKDYHLIAPYTGSNYDCEENSHSYLIGIPIELGAIPNPGFPAYFLNIKNERKYSPVASRDSLDDKSKTALLEKIAKDLEEIWNNIVVNTIEDYFSLSHLHKDIVEDDGGHWNEQLPYQTQRFCTLRQTSVKSYKKSDDTERYPDGIAEDTWTSVREHLAENTQYCYMHNKNTKRVKAALNLSPNMIVFVPRGDIHDRRNATSYLESFQIRNATLLFKENKINPNGNAKIVLHSYGGTSRINECDVQSDDIRVSDIKHYSGIIRSWNVNPIRVFKDSKKLTVGLTLDQYVTNTYNLKFETSEGILSGKQLLAKKSIYFLKTEDSKFKEEIDYELCKKIVPDASLFVKTDDYDNMSRLNFVGIIKEKKRRRPEIHLFDSGFDSAIARHKTKSLGLKSTSGTWLDEPEEAVKHISKIRKPYLRELYAKAYDGGWTDKKKSKYSSRLEKLLLKADKKQGELEVVLYLYDATADNDDYSWSDPESDVRNFASKQIQNLSKQPKIFAKIAQRILGNNIKVGKTFRVRGSYETRTRYPITFADANIQISKESLMPFYNMLSMRLEIASVVVRNCKTIVTLEEE